MTPEGHAGVLILPIDRVAQLQPPFAVRLLGRHSRLPIYLHVDRNWDFQAVSGRCGSRSCPVEYHEHRDRFECACTGAQYLPSGVPLRPSERALATFPVLYREEIVLIDLGGLPGR